MLPGIEIRGIPMKFTDKSIAAFHPPAGKADHIEFDDDIAGVGLRIRDGKKSWVFPDSIGSGATRTSPRLKLGDYPALPLRKARSSAQDLHAKVTLGGHPAAEKKAARAEAVDTFGSLVKRYLAHQKSELRASSYVENVRYLDKYAAPFHAQPATTIDKKRIAGLLSKIAEERGGSTSNRMRACLSAMFSWAMGEGLHEHNPVIGTAKREEKSRERVLVDSELKALWNALPDDDGGNIVRLLMLTGSREMEIGGLRWSEVDFDRDLISLPGERTKNGKPHEIPMSPPVREILESRPRSNGRDLIFGLSAHGYLGWGKFKERLDKAMADRGAALQHWTIHDIRRSVATGMAELGELPHVIEACLNHISGHKGGIAGIYNRAQYRPEKAQALAKWATHVLALAKGHKSNVRSLRRA
jgi:integrase